MLVLDDALQRLPWEGMECLRRHPVSRAPSLDYILRQTRVFKVGDAQPSSPSEPSSSQPSSSSTHRVVRDGVRLDKGYFIVDPEGNLPRTRSTLAPLVRSLSAKLGWTGVVGRAASEATMSAVLAGKRKEAASGGGSSGGPRSGAADVMLYCGHGAGERLMRRDAIEKLGGSNQSRRSSSSDKAKGGGSAVLAHDVRGGDAERKKGARPEDGVSSSSSSSSSDGFDGIDCVALLMGCSSGQLQANGEFAPSGMAAAYMNAGCPALVGNLWDVTDKDIDRFTERLVSTWTTADGGGGARWRQNSDDDDDHDDHDDDDDDKSASSAPRRVLLQQCVAEARDACKFGWLTAAAVVCYGVPVFTTRFVQHGGGEEGEDYDSFKATATGLAVFDESAA